MTITRKLTPEEHRDAVYLMTRLGKILKDIDYTQHEHLDTLYLLTMMVLQALSPRKTPALGQGMLREHEGLALASAVDAFGKMMRTGPKFTREEVEELLDHEAGAVLVRDEQLVARLVRLNARLVQLYPDAPRLEERVDYHAPGESVLTFKQ